MNKIMNIKDFLEKRIEKLRVKMQEKHLKAVIITQPTNVFYFTNFNPVLNSTPVFFLLDVDGSPCLLVHSLRGIHAREEGCITNVKLYGHWGNDIPVANSPVDAIKTILGTIDGNIGLELDTLDVNRYQEILDKLSPKKVVSVSAMLNNFRLLKDAHEIECIRKAAELVDLGIERTIECFTSNLSEAEATTEGQYAMRQLWHKKFRNSEVSGFGSSTGGIIDSFHVWCMSNGHIAYGCDCPRHYYPQTGDLTLPMAWAAIDGYYAENERTIIIGKTSVFKQHAYESMLEAREQVFNVLRPGTLLSELYNAAAETYIKNGFEKYLPGRIGHGLGCSAHEFPSVSSDNKMALQEGMVLTIEPGIMDKEWGGVRHSDTVLIKDNGFERLTKLKNDMIIIRKR